jgi:hypothetical protein
VDKINTYIKKLEACLSSYCPFLYSKILPPLIDRERDILFDQLKIDDEILKKVYTWKNGIENDGQLFTNSYNYTGFGVIPTLDYAAEILQIESINKYWKKSYFPLVVSFSGDFLLYETDRANANYGQLFLYCPTMGHVYEQISYFDSVYSLIDTIIESFNEKAFVYDNVEKFLDIDFDLSYPIATELNPKSKYWK